MCFETFAWLLNTDKRNTNCGLFWLKDDLCDHFKHNAMKTGGKIDSGKKPKTQFYIFLDKLGVLDSLFTLGYDDSTSSKFRVIAYSQDWLIAQ